MNDDTYNPGRKLVLAWDANDVMHRRADGDKMVLTGQVIVSICEARGWQLDDPRTEQALEETLVMNGWTMDELRTIVDERAEKAIATINAARWKAAN